MSCSAGRPPSLSSAAVVKLVKEFFWFKAVDELSVKEFPSYDDRNFYFRGTLEEARDHLQTDGVEDVTPHAQQKLEGEYVLKLNNPLFASYDVLLGINALLNHLHANGCTRCIRPLVGRAGADVLEITKEKLMEYGSNSDLTEKMKESKCFMRVVTFIPGECLDTVDKHHLTPRLLYDVGNCVGNACAILQVRVNISMHMSVNKIVIKYMYEAKL